MPTMRAITLNTFGGPEVLTQTVMPQPIPGPNQLLVQVKACGLNRADLLQRRGKYPPPPGESDILGLEMAGNITAMGKDAEGFGIGERVFGLVGSGAYAEYCLIDQGSAMPIPQHFSYIDAAAIPEAFLTAQEAVFTLGQLLPYESILIHAGGSGVGSAAIQLARQVNATIYTTTGSLGKMAKIKSFGADHIFNYKEQDFMAEIFQATQNRGVNVIIDFIGAEYLAQHLQLLQTDGRMSLVGLMRGRTAEVDLGLIHTKRLQLKGLTMRSRSLEEKERITRHFQQKWLPLFVSGQLKPVVDSIFPIHRVQGAHEYMESNLNIGKIILSFE
jgi:putative PIG3 family NAD(P)H quinone oxidoreductase